MALIYNATFDSQTRVLSLLDKAGNVISSCEVPSKELVDDPNKPLMLRAIEDNSYVTLKKRGSGTLDNTYQTSMNGTDWTDYTLGTKISLNKGESVYFRCSNHPTTQSEQNYVYFIMGGRIEAWHNAYSMISSDFSSAEGSVGEYGMNGLFEYCLPLTKAPLLLNALANYCYYGTFFDCKYLTKAPSLPATNLAEGCYRQMFFECQSLTKAPVLPATTLTDWCYYRMFEGCQSLKEVRVSATTTAMDALYNWLDGVSATGDFYCDPNATIFPTDSVSGIPKGWTRVPAVDDITKPLTFKATQDGSKVTLKKMGSPSGAFQTSRDGGNTWTDYTIDTAIPLNTGDEVSFRAKANRTSKQSRGDHFYFGMDGKIEAWHNVMSLYRTNDFATYNTLVESSFNGLFSGCISLTKAPVLPATTLATDCYEFMFSDCPSLTKAPELPATTLVFGCYSAMFFGCQSLTKAPVLPATTLADYCYYAMFAGCQSLTKAPELPATTLSSKCYYDMFQYCQSLTKAPELPATTLAQNCYNGMFYGCQSLKEVRIAATRTATDAMKEWLKNVSATGDFYCNPNATIFPKDSVSGIPANWNRHALSDYI